MQVADHVILNTGAKMPVIGLGTWKSLPNQVGDAVEYALTKGGYRHIDCAAIYRNEKEIGQAFKNIFRKGMVRAIGVANFTGAMLVDLLSYAKIKPAVNQIELHPYNQQARLVEFCQRNDMAVTAYSPLGSPGNMKDRSGAPILLDDPHIIDIAHAHHRSVAQVLIRWA